MTDRPEPNDARVEPRDLSRSTETMLAKLDGEERRAFNTLIKMSEANGMAHRLGELAANKMVLDQLRVEVGELRIARDELARRMALAVEELRAWRAAEDELERLLGPMHVTERYANARALRARNEREGLT